VGLLTLVVLVNLHVGRPISTTSAKWHEVPDVKNQVSIFIKQLGWFVTLSTMLGEFPAEPKSHKCKYNTTISHYQETYSVHQEQNPTYQLIQFKFCKQDPRYLARSMLWRVYIDIQIRFKLHKTKDAEEFHWNWEVARNELGKCVMMITTYGSNFDANVRKNVEVTQGIWNSRFKLMMEWKGCLPQKFLTIYNALASLKVPIYMNGILSCIFRLSDLVFTGIVKLPTARNWSISSSKQITMLLTVCDFWAFNVTVTMLKVLFQRIRQYLNSELLDSVKDPFGDGDVKLFNVEHLLCSVIQKQGRRRSRSPVWLIKLKERGFKVRNDSW